MPRAAVMLAACLTLGACGDFSSPGDGSAEPRPQVFGGSRPVDQVIETGADGQLRWRTASGLRAGDDLERLQEANADAERLDPEIPCFTHALVREPSLFEFGGLIPTVVARVEGDEVVALGVYPRGAGGGVTATPFCPDCGTATPPHARF